VIFVVALLALAGSVYRSSSTGAPILAFIVVGGYCVWRLLPRSDDGSEASPRPDYEALGEEVKVTFMNLEAPIKGVLHKSRTADAYRDIFDGDLMDLICRFAAIDGVIGPSEGRVFLSIFKILHPRTYAGLTAENGAVLLDGHRLRSPETFKGRYTAPLLVNLALQAGEPFATKLNDLMYKVALHVALADGPLSPTEQRELEALRNHSANPQLTPYAPGQLYATNIINEDAEGSPEPKLEPENIDPLFQSVTGIVTIESLNRAIKEWIGPVEKVLKVQLRRTRQSSMAGELLEQDIRTTIIRFGRSDGALSKYAAHLYLEIFKCLHPKTYALWTDVNAFDFLQRMLDLDQGATTSEPWQPYTLKFIKEFDAEHGTALAKATGHLLLAIAAFAAAINGEVSNEKQQEISRLRVSLDS
jgi:hypothetical protein